MLTSMYEPPRSSIPGIRKASPNIDDNEFVDEDELLSELDSEDLIKYVELEELLLPELVEKSSNVDCVVPINPIVSLELDE